MIGINTLLFIFVFFKKKTLSIPADILAASSDSLDRFADTSMLTAISGYYSNERVESSVWLWIVTVWIGGIAVKKNSPDGNACCQ
jgi:hypothetical protein